MLAVPRIFTPESVRGIIKENKPGVYALGNDANGFVVGYVGRSDSCLQTRLSTHNHLYRFDYFIFKYALSINEAFKLECEYWHASKEKQIANLIHPASPSNSGMKCPYCDFAAQMNKFFAV
jgi:GIY-YIG catalytic domain